MVASQSWELSNQVSVIPTKSKSSSYNSSSCSPILSTRLLVMVNMTRSLDWSHTISLVDALGLQIGLVTILTSGLGALVNLPLMPSILHSGICSVLALSTSGPSESLPVLRSFIKGPSLKWLYRDHGWGYNHDSGIGFSAEDSLQCERDLSSNYPLYRAW